MEPIITMENFRRFAYCNDEICRKPIRGLVLSFLGLGNCTMMEDQSPEGIFFGEQGILYLLPYQNPWAWMNRQNIAFTETLLDLLFAHYALPADLPIVSTGRSMGGQSALVYMAYAKRTPVACVVNCPVCDLVYHSTERPDVLRTVYSAFSSYDGSLEEALQSASPIHLLDRLPRTASYTLYHCEQDQAVNKAMHTDRFVSAMAIDHQIVCHSVPDRGHCDLPEDILAQYHRTAAQAILDRYA